MRLEIVCKDRVGIAQSVLAIFVGRGIDIRGIEFKRPGNIFINIPDLDFSELQGFMPELRLLDGVIDVKTTPYMPCEHHKHEFETLVEFFPEPFISINTKGFICRINNAAAQIMSDTSSNIINGHISNWLKGFNITRWLDCDDVLAQSQQVKFQDDDFIADIMPIYVTEGNAMKVLAGAVLILKTEVALEQRNNVFKKVNNNCFAGIQASSRVMRKLLREVKSMALLDSSMLIAGETGTGKELLARACHNASDRGDKPFMTLSCATLPDDVAETELFGSGAPGDLNSKKGLFESADGGTIFFDEVGEMSPTLQVKVLRVIQDGLFRRIDDEQEIKVNVRIISSTKKDLLNMVSLGEFREDLYYRLNVLGLNIPPLRERQSDIVPLARLFIEECGQRLGKTHISFDKECLEFIEYYPWPGNVRQLENVLIRAVSLIENNIITINDLQLPTYTKEHGYLAQGFEGTLDAAVKNFEASLLRKLYPAYPSSRQLAKKLGLSHTAIANKLREYDINKKTVKI